MNASYRLGISIVAATVLVSAGLVAVGLARVGPGSRPSGRAGPGRRTAIALGSFRLTERSGRPVTEADLAGDVWVAAFIFTRCPTSCPRISTVMKGLQGPLGDAGVRLVSLSVDPEYDTPEVLTRYADGLRGRPRPLVVPDRHARPRSST